MTPEPVADDRARVIAEAVWDALDAQHDKAWHVHASECCWSFGGAIDAIAAALSDTAAPDHDPTTSPEDHA